MTQDEEANIFATALLMPMELMRREYADVEQIAKVRHWGAEEVVSEMARRFHVSEARMALRLGEILMIGERRGRYE